jgi:hypothetical protein
MRPHVCAAALLVTLAASARAEENKETKEAEEPRGQVNFELVAGAGQVEALNPASPPFSGQLRYERAPTDVIATGLVASALYDFTPHFALGMRLPLAIAELRPEGDATRSTANLGNVELEAEVKTEPSKGVELFAGAGVALPTSSGDELPTEQELAGSQAGIDPIAADKYAVNKAVASAYGYEQNAMWFAGYLGVVPVVGAKLRFGRLRVEPYAKSEMMFSVRHVAQERAIVEVAVGGRAAVTVVPWLDVGLRAWASLTLTDHEGDPNVGVIEPELRVGRERWRVTAGLLVPFAGELATSGWISGRLSASVLF